MRAPASCSICSASRCRCWGGAPPRGPRDRERRVWRLTAGAALVWAVGLLIYALREWFGQTRSYPSSADAFLVGAFLLLLAALADEFRLVHPLLTAPPGPG